MSRNRAAVRRAKREGISYAEALRRIREGKKQREVEVHTGRNDDVVRDTGTGGGDDVVRSDPRRAGSTGIVFHDGLHD